jgi:STE24 endopeptidase
MRLRHLALLLCLSLPLAAHAAETPAEHAANVYAAQELAANPLHSNIPDYSLCPADLAKSQHLGKIHETLHFVDEIWGIVSLLLLLGLGGIAWMRDTAVKASANRWIQGYLFLLLYSIAGFLLELPLDLYEQHLSRVYGLSVQSWLSWFGDQGKAFGLSWIIGGLLLMLLFWIIRKLPRSWWLVFWGVSIPIVLAGIFVAPYINLLFDKFEPLQLHHPELVAQLEQVVAKGHMNIPPDRMFLMKASEKVTTLNAYVTGFGASKRVVVWDTSLTKGTPDEVLFIFGHESGHYVLGHIVSSVIFTMGVLFITLYLGYLFVQWAIAKYGTSWRIPSQNDWAALAVLLLAFSLFSLVLEPIDAAFSRAHEHAADVYGQEAIHGLVADPQSTAQKAFDVLGTSGFSDPNPNPFYEFWTYDHPSIGRRAAFAHAYNPWAPNMEPKYFKK